MLGSVDNPDFKVCDFWKGVEINATYMRDSSANMSVLAGSLPQFLYFLFAVVQKHSVIPTYYPHCPFKYQANNLGDYVALFRFLLPIWLRNC